MFIDSDLLPEEGYDIPNSGAFADEENDYLSRTFSASGTTATFSMFVKRASLGVIQSLFGYSNGVNASFGLKFLADDTIDFFSYTSAYTGRKQTSAVYRDVAEFYHLVFVIDTSNATSSDRLRLYVNGLRVTDFSSSVDPSLSASLNLSQSWAWRVGAEGGVHNRFLSGYISEFLFIDGQALTPSDFAQTDVRTGQWVAKKYTGTYGTNGFYLDFQNGANLGEDQSGNNNDWTNSGVTQSVDSPTNNHALLNPLSALNGSTVSNSGRGFTTDATTGGGIHSSIAMPSSGKWKIQVKPQSGTTSQLARIGLITELGTLSTDRYLYLENGNKFSVAGGSESYGASYTDNDIIDVLFDADAGELRFYKNNVDQGLAFSGLTGLELFLIIYDSNSGTLSGQVRFSEAEWTYAAPSGYKSLCAQNLPEPAIKLPENYFKPIIYDDGAGSKTVGFQPDLVWFKSRGSAFNHKLVDSVRGATLATSSNTTAVEATEATGLTSFDANGFTVGADTDYSDTTGVGMVAWCFKEGATPGFDIVQYSGDNTANRNIGHGLGVAPDFALIKRLDSAEDWFAWHQGLTGNDYFLKLNDNSAESNTASPFGTGNWSSTQFMVDNDATNNANATGTDNYIAYLFAEVEGFSKFGSYTGNGNTDGPFVYCGFRPAFVMVKRTSSIGSWQIYDAVRSTFNESTLVLQADASSVEADTTVNEIDILSNGFKLRGTGANSNANASSYVFMALAESPFKYANAR